ncbi:hypothetical protein FALBO_2654 [Fusarium albosuccineum]|uniref:F-box domain-containing protein n=1 Tax=Fusarium albosuccineum TaxID=1237068 RepID=A0A8H4PCF8_9HYPO|nr:hypothetical protein FALBO_2654 [Fusarium albosuccineum]
MATFGSPVSKLIELLSAKSQNPSLNIVDAILSYLGIADIYALHAACRSLRWLVDHMTSSSSLLNINKQLDPFVKDSARFRYELGKHDALIAGEFVRNFFEFGRWTIPSLLVYVRRGCNSEDFTNYLRDNEGYCAEPGQHKIYRRESLGERCIVIMPTPDSPIVEIINTALTTAGANVISWNKAYSLFPILTIMLHKFYPLKPFDNKFSQTLQRYAKRGWTTRDILWPDLTDQGIPQKECRQISDSNSLIIELGQSPRGNFTPDYILESAIFSVIREANNTSGRGRTLLMSIEPVRSIALRYIHTNGASGTYCKRWEKFLHERLDRWIYIEIVRLNPEQRPRGFYWTSGQYHVSIPKTYTLPDTWDYVDDQIIAWFREWEGKL